MLSWVVDATYAYLWYTVYWAVPVTTVATYMTRLASFDDGVSTMSMTATMA